MLRDISSQMSYASFTPDLICSNWYVNEGLSITEGTKGAIRPFFMNDSSTVKVTALCVKDVSGDGTWKTSTRSVITGFHAYHE